MIQKNAGLIIQKGANNLAGGLIHACQYGNIDIVKLLIKSGANNFLECLDITKDENIIECLIKANYEEKFNYQIESIKRSIIKKDGYINKNNFTLEEMIIITCYLYNNKKNKLNYICGLFSCIPRYYDNIIFILNPLPREIFNMIYTDDEKGLKSYMEDVSKIESLHLFNSENLL